MFKLIKLDFKNCINNDKFRIVFLFFISLSLSSFFTMCIEVYNTTSIELLPTALLGFTLGRGTRAIFNLILVIMPLVTCVIYSDSYIYDRDNNIDIYFFTRISKAKYFISKIITIFIVVFFTIFLTITLNEILTFIAVPDIGTNGYRGVPEYQVLNNSNIFFLQSIFNRSPFIYKILITTILSLYGAFIAIIGFNISILFRVKRITLFISMFLGVHISTIILPVEFTIDLYIQGLPFELEEFIITIIGWVLVCIVTALIGICKEKYR